MKTDTESLDFAFIGHLEDWVSSTDFVNSIRKPELEKLTEEKVKEVFPFIPPRNVFHVKVRSKTGAEINGAYIESFIDPEKLNVQNLRTNISKVKRSMDCAEKLGAKIATLGGFTSIVLEGNFQSVSSGNTKFSTGNTLTAAFIVKGVEEASRKYKIDLKYSNVLIIGATGDIGLACTNYFKDKVGQLLLCARNYDRLEKRASELSGEGIAVSFSDVLDDLVPYSDIIICAASSSEISIENCKKGVLICDAGYPKNLEEKIENNTNVNVFHGGMGHVAHGFEFIPDYSKSFYKFPVPGISHGCILEGMVLAFENKFESYSYGKGNITVECMKEIYDSAVKHGITLAPFYNSKGLL
jgi:fatty aldehyde-generating acyl-ACP reductase